MCLEGTEEEKNLELLFVKRGRKSEFMVKYNNKMMHPLSGRATCIVLSVRQSSMPVSQGMQGESACAVVKLVWAYHEFSGGIGDEWRLVRLVWPARLSGDTHDC